MVLQRAVVVKYYYVHFSEDSMKIKSILFFRLCLHSGVDSVKEIHYKTVMIIASYTCSPGMVISVKTFMVFSIVLIILYPIKFFFAKLLKLSS